MRYSIKSAVAFGIIIAVAHAHADNKACLLEGSFKFAGKTTEIRDCLQNGGIDQKQFLEQCKGIAKIGAGLGAPPKVSYLGACPANPLAVCEGMFGQPLASYYYKRNAQDLADAKSSCIAQGGKWRA
ncbi:MAG TPA: hypothetical protein VJ577_05360 [Burkholderiaceae bacterium]|nr:hypothetical protein [Burkholderiaceae bacterium]